MYGEWQLLAKKIDPSWIRITICDFMAQNYSELTDATMFRFLRDRITCHP